MFRILVLLTALLAGASHLVAQENFVGNFAEPSDGGNLDTSYSSFDGSVVTIVPRAHASEALNGATRWRNIHFAIRGMKGKTPTFRLPLTSPGSGKMILNGDTVSFQNIKIVWSYEARTTKWKEFDTYTRSGSGTSTWKVDARNNSAFTQDVVYVSVNERAPVSDFYEWLESSVFTHPRVKPTPSEAAAGTFMIGYQSGAPASAAFSRAIPDMPLYGFMIKDPAANPTKLVMLVSGQHPYEGQTKVALRAAIEWILKSDSAEAKAYRAQYLTVVYPFVNPTGEMAGLWRGTAYAPSKDTNRNWDTAETVPSRNRGIDTVIVHKNAMKTDIAALGMGEPYAVFDYHQNFGDKAGKPDYVLHCTAATGSAVPARLYANSDFAPFYSRLAAMTGIDEIASNLTSQETLRGYMIARGVVLPLTFERSVYNTLASERAFGVASVKALVDPASLAVVPPPPPPVVSDPEPVEEPEAPASEKPAEDKDQEVPATPKGPTQPSTGPMETLLADSFQGSGSLIRRKPDGVAPEEVTWKVESGTFVTNSDNVATTNTSGRATIDASASDAQVIAKLWTGSNPTGLVLRASDSSNYLRFTITSTNWTLQKTAAGSTTTIASGKQAFATDVPHTLSAVLQGALVELAVDGVRLGQFEIGFNVNATRHGLLCVNSGTRKWDSFEIRTPGDGSSGSGDPAPSEGGGQTGQEPSEPATPAIGTIVVTDSFAGSSSLINRRPDGTAPTDSVWKVESGTFVTSANGTATTNTSGRATIESFAANVQAIATLRTGTNPTGLVLRASDKSNYLRFMISATNWTLQKTEAGTTTTIGSGKRTFATSEPHTISAVMVGSTIELSADGVALGTFEVSFNRTATKHGLLSNGSGTREWDSFELRTATAAP